MAAREPLLGWRPRSLQSRQLLAASLGLLAFLAITGYALDRAFIDVAGQGLHDRLKAYAYAYLTGIEFARDGILIPPEVPPDGRFDQPGGGLYADVELPNGRWRSASSAIFTVIAGRGGVTGSSLDFKTSSRMFGVIGGVVASGDRTIGAGLGCTVGKTGG